MMKNSDDRRKLLGAMMSMRAEAPVLSVVDTLVTVRERVEAVAAAMVLSAVLSAVCACVRARVHVCPDASMIGLGGGRCGSAAVQVGHVDAHAARC